MRRKAEEKEERDDGEAGPRPQIEGMVDAIQGEAVRCVSYGVVFVLAYYASQNTTVRRVVAETARMITDTCKDLDKKARKTD